MCYQIISPKRPNKTREKRSIEQTNVIDILNIFCSKNLKDVSTLKMLAFCSLKRFYATTYFNRFSKLFFNLNYRRANVT